MKLFKFTTRKIKKLACACQTFSYRIRNGSNLYYFTLVKESERFESSKILIECRSKFLKVLIARKYAELKIEKRRVGCSCSAKFFCLPKIFNFAIFSPQRSITENLEFTGKNSPLFSHAGHISRTRFQS